MTPSQAAADLARAEGAAGRIRTESRWMARYMAVFAVGFAVLTLILGLVEPLWLRLTLSGMLWVPLVVGMVWWALRRRSVMQHVGRRFVAGWAGTGGLYAIVVAVGTPGQLGNAAYWVPGAVLVAVQLGATAWRESRR